MRHRASPHPNLMPHDRAALRAALEGRKEAKTSEVEAYLTACGWTFSRQMGSRQAWTKPGKRTLILHGRVVKEYLIKQVMEATSSD